MLSYVDEGLACSAVVQSLYQSSLQVHKHNLTWHLRTSLALILCQYIKKKQKSGFSKF